MRTFLANRPTVSPLNSQVIDSEECSRRLDAKAEARRRAAIAASTTEVASTEVEVEVKVEVKEEPDSAEVKAKVKVEPTAANDPSSAPLVGLTTPSTSRTRPHRTCRACTQVMQDIGYAGTGVYFAALGGGLLLDAERMGSLARFANHRF